MRVLKATALTLGIVGAFFGVLWLFMLAITTRPDLVLIGFLGGIMAAIWIEAYRHV